MAVKVFKYKLFDFPNASEVQSMYDIFMPHGAELLCVQHQKVQTTTFLGGVHDSGPVCLWARVDDLNQPVRRRIVIYGTGHKFEPGHDDGTYIDTIQLASGQLVIHVFDLGEQS